MVSGFISRLVILIFGTLYPAYASYKAVRTKNVKEYVKWMMYWIVFALFTCAETFTDLFLGFWFPFYYEIKIITVIYLLSPATKGSSILYRKFVHPVLIKREQEIDEYIAKMKEQGYHTVLNLGSKGVNYATTLIMQTAIKSGGGLFNQLKKSYSLNDLSDPQDLRKMSGDSADDADNPYNEDPRLIRRQIVQGGFHFPEANLSQRPGGDDLRQIPSYENMSSGYSSGEPYFYGLQQPMAPHLVRTASLGPSSRIRTRASTKQGLSKRSSLTEGGSTWTAVELHESQNESDNFCNFPLSHSASFPFAFHPIQHFILPQHQQMFGHLTQNQMFTFINQLQNPQLSKNTTVGLENYSDEDLENISNEESSNFSVEISVEKESDEKKQKSSLDNSSNDEVKVAKNENVDIKISTTETEEKKTSDKGENAEVKDENITESAAPNENSDVKDKSSQERSGKYRKKPAPTPPVEESNSKTSSLTAEEEESSAFFTPNASPKLPRKESGSGEASANKADNESNPHDSNFLEVPKKSKPKSKKTDFNIPKKLHMPKMTFSFWHPKSGKQASSSETSSVASAETQSEDKNELEYFIPLKDEDDNSREKQKDD